MRSLECSCLIFGLTCLWFAACALAQDQAAEDTWEMHEPGNEHDTQRQRLELKQSLQTLHMADDSEDALQPPKSQPVRAKHHHEEVSDAEEGEEREFAYDPYRDNFYDIYDDGTYVYGYSLPNGVRRYERSFYSDKYKGLVVEGFYTEARQHGQQLAYELRCYRSDYRGHQPLRVKYLRRPPVVQRDVEPNVDCFD